MRLAGKLSVPTAMALAALALAATSASAAPVEFTDEATGLPCDPCVVHAEGDSQMIAHTIFGPIVVSGCHDSFEAEVWHQEEPTTEQFGHIYQYVNGHGVNANCTRENCLTAAESEWPATHAEETAPQEGTMNVRFCLRDEQGTENHCEISVHVEEISPGVAHFTADPNDPIAPSLCSVDGTEVEIAGEWQSEASGVHQQMEIVHL